MITSVNNGQVKNIIQLNQKTKARREQGLFVAEGRKMFGEAPRDWISKVYVSEALSGDAELMAQVEKLPYEIVTDSVFRQMSDTQTPQKVSRGNRVRATQSKATMAVATWERLATGLFSSALELKRSLPELASMAI